MKKFILLSMLLSLVTFATAGDNSQCIFTGAVNLKEQGFLPACTTEIPIIELLKENGDFVRRATYDPVSTSYGVNAFSGDGFSDSDKVMFRIIFRCDTVIARTVGEEAIFIGYPQPTPPEPRSVDLMNNLAPQFEPVQNDTTYEDDLFELQLHASDPDTDLVLYSLIDAPSWLSIDPQTGLLHGTPGLATAGTNLVKAVADDGYYRGTDTVQFMLTVIHVNHAPGIFHLLAPEQYDTVEYNPADSLMFSWERSVDPDAGDQVAYLLLLVGTAMDTIRVNTYDTVAYVRLSRLLPFQIYAWSVFATDGFEEVAAADTFFFGTMPYEQVRELPGIPGKFVLGQNYPNPFNPATTIRFSVPEQSIVTIKVYDSSGREIATVVDEVLDAGNYSTVWNAENLAAGVYYYKITAGNFTETKRMLLIK